MNLMENIDDQSKTQQIFQNVMNILDEEGMIIEQLFPFKKTPQISQIENNHEWKQWIRNDYANIPYINIQEDRKFLFDEKHYHMWYKNINLPTVTVTAQHESFQGGRFSVMLDCFGVQISEDQQYSSSSKDSLTSSFVGGYKRFSLEGEGIQQTILTQKQQMIFQRIKCKETSYNHKGLRFFIILTIYENETNKPILIRLSPSLYIESRKKSFQETQTQLGFSHPFIPEALTKAYAKCSFLNQESIESFNEYYSSCSIRHKIIHPLFVFLKFSKAIKLYYNKHIIGENLEEKEGTSSLFFEIQSQIYNQIQKEQSQNNNGNPEEINKALKTKTQKSSFFPLIGLMVNYESLPSNDKKSAKKIYQKVYRFIKPLVGGIVQVYFDTKNIPHCMKELIYKEHMKEDYKSIYHQLTDLKVKKSQILGPSNTQYSHIHHSNQLQDSSENNQNEESSSNENDSGHNDSDKKKFKQDQKPAIEEKLLKKRSIIQRFNYNNEIDEGHDDQIKSNNSSNKQNQVSKDKKDIYKSQQTNQLESIILAQKPKKKQDITNTRNSLDLNEDSECEYKEEVQGRINISRSQTRKETLSKIPEMPSYTNKEASTTNPTPLTSFPEYNSQTTIFPDQVHTPNQLPFVHQVFQMPQGMVMPFQNSYPQTIVYPMNHYMPQPQTIHPSPAHLTAQVPQPVQVIMNPMNPVSPMNQINPMNPMNTINPMNPMNPYQYQNMYYPYSGFPMAIQPQPQIIQPGQTNSFIQPNNCVSYQNQSQIISIQPVPQYFQPQKITDDAFMQKQFLQSQQKQEK